MTLSDVCAEIRNWFEKSKVFGVFQIKNGKLLIAEEGDISVQPNQYIRIVGSVFNDGVYVYPPENLTDETFEGAVWSLAIPKPFLDLVDSMGKWEEDNRAVIDSPYQSESFGGYSYTKSGGNSGSGLSSGRSAVWNHFGHDLNRWRKIR